MMFTYINEELQYAYACIQLTSSTYVYFNEMAVHSYNYDIYIWMFTYTEFLDENQANEMSTYCIYLNKITQGLTSSS